MISMVNVFASVLILYCKTFDSFLSIKAYWIREDRNTRSSMLWHAISSMNEKCWKSETSFSSVWFLKLILLGIIAMLALQWYVKYVCQKLWYTVCNDKMEWIRIKWAKVLIQYNVNNDTGSLYSAGYCRDTAFYIVTNKRIWKRWHLMIFTFKN